MVLFYVVTPSAGSVNSEMSQFINLFSSFTVQGKLDVSTRNIINIIPSNVSQERLRATRGSFKIVK